MVDAPERRSHFTRRLEAFSDIVFGFSLAQLTLQLQLPAEPADLLGNPLRWVVFFATFALISGMWLAHYRMFRLAFEPERLDIFLNFAFLAAIAVLPFAMQAIIKYSGRDNSYTLYVAAFLGISLPMVILLWRGLARRKASLSDTERLDLWQAFLRNTCVLLASGIALVSLQFTTVEISSIPYMVLAVLTALLRRVVKTVPARFRPSAPAVAG